MDVMLPERRVSPGCLSSIRSLWRLVRRVAVVKLTAHASGCLKGATAQPYVVRGEEQSGATRRNRTSRVIQDESPDRAIDSRAT